MSISIYLKCHSHVTTSKVSKHNKHVCILESKRRKKASSIQQTFQCYTQMYHPMKQCKK